MKNVKNRRETRMRLTFLVSATAAVNHDWKDTGRAGQVP